jgi:hypothetical protein
MVKDEKHTPSSGPGSEHDTDREKGSDNQGPKDENHGHDRQVTIIVNAREKPWTRKEISFAEVVALAFPTLPAGENIVFTITYRKGEGNKPEGTLTEGHSVKVKDGMIFNVTATDKS